MGTLRARFNANYWLEKDRDGEFPMDLHRAMADAGWLGICTPEAYGGSGLGITEASILMRTIAESGAGLSGASSIHMNIFGLQPVVVYGTGEQKQRYLPSLIRGKQKPALASPNRMPAWRLRTSRCAPSGSREGMCCAAESWIELKAAEQMTRRAGWKYDQGLPCGPDANAAKFYAAEVGFRACTRAVATHGGMGYAKEYHAERYLRETAHRADQPAADPVPHRRESARPAEELLRDSRP